MPLFILGIDDADVSSYNKCINRRGKLEIKVVMHSQLDVYLKPDVELIFSAMDQLRNSSSVVNEESFAVFASQVEQIKQLINNESDISALIKTSLPQQKEELLKNKRNLSAQIDDLMTAALENLAKAGGGDLYHYNFDLHYNRIIAGLMGATCYMKDTFDSLQQKGIKNILAIASTVENNGHHSTFGHAHLTLEITGIPKALAMVLNNEKEYCTSEKSARYTIMTDIDPAQNALFEKWKDILTAKIGIRYGDKAPFFDEKGIKVCKLAQENARYMISVFTPTNMVYTTSFRQLDYLAHWFEDVIADENANDFYKAIKPQMREFVNFVKENNLYSQMLEDHKGRKLSLFGDGLLKEVMTDSVYALSYHASFACLAQLHRHRTIHYNIDEFDFVHENKRFYIPPIISNGFDTSLIAQWQKDMQSVADSYPQGMLVPIVEKGETNDFLLKAFERVCVLAQKEIRDLTQENCWRMAIELNKEALDAYNESINLHNMALASTGLSNEALLLRADKREDQGQKLKQKAQVFDKLSKGARCTAGYKCPSPCHFADGIKLESEV